MQHECIRVQSTPLEIGKHYQTPHWLPTHQSLAARILKRTSWKRHEQLSPNRRRRAPPLACCSFVRWLRNRRHNKPSAPHSGATNATHSSRALGRLSGTSGIVRVRYSYFISLLPTYFLGYLLSSEECKVQSGISRAWRSLGFDIVYEVCSYFDWSLIGSRSFSLQMKIRWNLVGSRTESQKQEIKKRFITLPTLVALSHDR